jgi:RimJ/RimL family protein N-acetyltransferase
MVNHLFYRASRSDLVDSKLADRFSWELWCPSWRSFTPPGLPVDREKFAARFALHAIHFYSPLDYSALLIRFDRRLVHYSIATGRYWKTLFLGKRDIRIGHVWTDPEYRGEQMSSFAISKIAELMDAPGRYFWYVVSADNPGPIRAAERAGMKLYAKGSPVRMFGNNNLFFFYRMDQRSAITPLIAADFPPENTPV